MPQHDANAAPSAAQPGHQGKGGEEVHEAQGVIHRHGPAVGPGDPGAIVRHQPGEDGEYIFVKGIINASSFLLYR